MSQKSADDFIIHQNNNLKKTKIENKLRTPISKNDFLNQTQGYSQ